MLAIFENDPCSTFRFLFVKKSGDYVAVNVKKSGDCAAVNVKKSVDCAAVNVKKSVDYTAVNVYQFDLHLPMLSIIINRIIFLSLTGLCNLSMTYR